ncbi:Asp/Glu/hydantoin racemase [Hypericibacter adhaerens]|jgi:allantoin racemase|uniref:Asp/Glu/hydantoin racemase n=1 Tax=Hypericibacter adhaerens TaxID=2602016 RepID=A0A5J6N8D9_9PROT|nr:aspartate/glutamate racemase family protein [Hypericibacter adhaerens]QEX25240.1 Asp/Glu/hydantoin racemase [Hypericibacter adhaerens]
MSVRINFINPFGTPVYNNLIKETLLSYARPDTEIVITNTENCPENIDYYYNKHIVELVVMEDVMRAEQQGFDAVIVGCCYDPGVRVARELVDIPVIGPLEATIMMAPYYGHDYVLVTDHHKAVPYLRDLTKLYGGPECRDVTCIDWWVTDMIRDTEGVAKDAIAKCRKAKEKSRAEVVVLGCTIIAASMEKWLIDTKAPRDETILNTNTFALKMAESLGDLKKQGLYNIDRGGYYQKPQQRNGSEFAEVRAKFGRPSAL